MRYSGSEDSSGFPGIAGILTSHIDEEALESASHVSQAMPNSALSTVTTWENPVRETLGEVKTVQRSRREVMSLF